MARRSAIGAVSRNHRELIHGETENGDPLWGLKPPLFKRPIHGGLGGHFMVIWTQFMVLVGGVRREHILHGDMERARGRASGLGKNLQNSLLKS